MSTVTELFDSRIGGGRGYIGSLGRTRRFRVAIDTYTDDPIRELQLLSGRGGVALGDAYPYADDALNGIVCVFFEPIDRLTDTDWIVEAIYDVPTFFPNATTPWKLRLRGSLVVEDLEYDLDGNPIGSPQYALLPDTATSSPFIAKVDTDATGAERVVNLGPPPDNSLVNFQPGQRTRDVGELFLEKTVGNLNTSRVSQFIAHTNKVNEDYLYVVTNLSAPFSTRIAPPGTVKFTPPDIYETPGYALGQRVPGVLFIVQFAFQYDRLGWDHRNIHKYVDPNTGQQSPVVDRLTNRPVVSKHRMYDKANFTSLLASI